MLCLAQRTLLMLKSKTAQLKNNDNKVINALGKEMQRKLLMASKKKRLQQMKLMSLTQMKLQH
jgi:hypothetical protein